MRNIPRGPGATYEGAACRSALQVRARRRLRIDLLASRPALARASGVHSAINLLCFLGLIDCEDEVEIGTFSRPVQRATPVPQASGSPSA